MKLNRSVLVAAMIIGSTVAVAGCNTSGAEDEGTEQSSAQQESGVTLASAASDAHRFGGGWGRERREGVRERREGVRERREGVRERRAEHRREERREERRENGWWGGIRRWWRR